MGICQNCNKEITLKENETTCPNCGMYPYFCWNCKTKILLDQTKECQICHYYICPKCSSCGSECNIHSLIIKLLTDYPELQQLKKTKIRDLIYYIYIAKEGKIRLECLERKIGVSYAKGRLRNMVLKLKGYKTKNKEDCEMFKKRFDSMVDKPLGTTWTVNQEREDGTLGVEVRDISNLMVCMGSASKKIIKVINNNKVERKYEEYTRVELEPCKHHMFDNLIKWKCQNKKCGKIFDKETKSCDNCVYVKGKNKGEPYEVKETASYCNFCQLSRNLFIETKSV